MNILKKSNEETYIIKGKLQEKEEEINDLQLKDKLKDDVIANISDQLVTITEKLKDLENRT